MGRLAFFPTPYPDEIFYSVLCRYHVRSGNPGMVTTIKELWKHKGFAKSLYLPSGLNAIVDQLPEGSGITLDSLIWKHTMFPYVRPALPQCQAELVYAMLWGEEKGRKSTYRTAGLIGRKLSLPQYLRFCPACVQSDIKRYGEAYWHRLHQLPGVYICPEHKKYIYDSVYFTHMILRYFFPAASELCANLPHVKRYSKKVENQLVTFAEDSAWLLEHGRQLGTLEDMYEKHFRLLEFNGYRGSVSSTSLCKYHELNRAIHKFYEKEFLGKLCSFDEDDYSSWPATFARINYTNPPTSQHLLMMRFLSGSPQQFLESVECFLPFGKPPWPCHNKICDFYLKDCIEQIDIKVIQGQHNAIFTCPHCGFSYKRGKAIPKELQYEGQVHVVDFGWLWKHKLTECLLDKGFSVNQTVIEMRYPDTTIRKYAVFMKLLPESRMPPKKTNFKKVKRIKRINKIPESIESHRMRWLQTIAENPDTKRSALSRKDLANYKWMLANDHKWFEANTPVPVHGGVDWSRRDEDYLKRVKQAVDDAIGSPGKPQRLCYSAIANRSGIGNKIYHVVSKLPKTHQYLDAITESKDEWRKRKILWAIEMLKKDDRNPSVYGVREKSGISTRVFQRFKTYIQEQVALHKEEE